MANRMPGKICVLESQALQPVSCRGGSEFSLFFLLLHWQLATVPATVGSVPAKTSCRASDKGSPATLGPETCTGHHPRTHAPCDGFLWFGGRQPSLPGPTFPSSGVPPAETWRLRPFTGHLPARMLACPGDSTFVSPSGTSLPPPSVPFPRCNPFFPSLPTLDRNLQLGQLGRLATLAPCYGFFGPRAPATQAENQLPAPPSRSFEWGGAETFTGSSLGPPLPPRRRFFWSRAATQLGRSFRPPVSATVVRETCTGSSSPTLPRDGFFGEPHTTTKPSLSSPQSALCLPKKNTRRDLSIGSIATQPAPPMRSSPLVELHTRSKD